MSAALGNPANRPRAVSLTFDQIRYAVANAVLSVTEIVEIKNRGQALTVDSGWRKVADTVLAFTQLFANLQPAGAILQARDAVTRCRARQRGTSRRETSDGP